MPKEYFKKKGQRNKFKMTNPLKQVVDPMLSETAMDPTLGGNVDSAYLYKSPNKLHDGTESSTTHYADGTPKDDREVEFSERHEEEVDSDTEGQDQDKIFDDEGNQIGYWEGNVKYDMDGKPMKSAIKNYRKTKRK